MPCCPSTRYDFIEQSATIIPYTSGLQAQHGSIPKVLVRYYDPDTGEYYFSTFFTRVSFVGGNVVIDHGGSPLSGIITLS